MEGVSYEAGSIAGTNGLGKLIYFYDDNHITIDGTTSISFTEDRAKRFEASAGTSVGRRRERSRRAANRDRERAGRDGRPSMIIVRSHIGFGAPHAVDTAGAHGSPLGAEEVARDQARARLGPDKHFYIPDEVAAHMNQTSAARGSKREWEERVREVVEGIPGRAEELGRRVGRRDRRLDAAGVRSRRELATRAAGKTVMQAFSRRRADDDRRRGRPRRVDLHRIRRRRSLLQRAGSGATSPSASASTRWARSSTASRRTAAA